MRKCLNELSLKHGVLVRKDAGGWSIIVVPDRKGNFMYDGIKDAGKWGYLIFEIQNWSGGVYNVKDHFNFNTMSCVGGFTSLVKIVKEIDKVLVEYGTENLKTMVGGFVTYL